MSACSFRKRLSDKDWFQQNAVFGAKMVQKRCNFFGVVLFTVHVSIVMDGTFWHVLALFDTF